MFLSILASLLFLLKSPDTSLESNHLSVHPHQVVRRMQEKLSLQESKNTFALYEQNALWEQPVAGSALIADILTRFEKHHLPLVNETDKIKTGRQTHNQNTLPSVPGMLACRLCIYLDLSNSHAECYPIYLITVTLSRLVGQTRPPTGKLDLCHCLCQQSWPKAG